MKTIKKMRQKQSVDGSDVEQKVVFLSGGGMQRFLLPVIPLFVIHFASVFPEVFVALDVQLHKVADFDRVDFPSAAMADLRHGHSGI